MAVYKDKNGTWYLSVRYVNWQGEHARKVKRGFATKREATEWERIFLSVFTDRTHPAIPVQVVMASVCL